MWAGNDIKYMHRALRLGEKGLGYTTPNPAVGAVVARQDMILGEGWHQRAGTPHAEIHALKAAGDAAKGADLYVTLEPCNHTGRTPPCTHAILQAGIRRVIIGTLDPNPKVVGGGAGFLRERGLEVEIGCLRDECRLLNAPFAKHMLTGMPWVRSKVACSLDGRTATRTGHSKWITNQQARSSGHRLREISNAILVGKGTIVADDPQLTCRKGKKAVKDPIRVVLDSGLSVDPSSRICHLKSSAPTVIIGVEGKSTEVRRQALEASGTKVWFTQPDGQGRVDIRNVLRMLGNIGVQSLLVEGGGTVHGAFWDQAFVDEAFFYYAPMVIGGKDARPAIGGSGAVDVGRATRLSKVQHRKLGDNWLVRGLVTNIDSFWSRP
jgi:diaminohydroxyphosphoribosylaminopyrimidine deaminase/5-amino-6-(5-phosphoribosylamino)uracil reductase